MNEKQIQTVINTLLETLKKQANRFSKDYTGVVETAEILLEYHIALNKGKLPKLNVEASAKRFSEEINKIFDFNKSKESYNEKQK